jgi:hypothetical protein
MNISNSGDGRFITPSNTDHNLAAPYSDFNLYANSDNSFRTPETMTPLFNSVENLANNMTNRNSVASGYHTEDSRFTNGTNHGTVDGVEAYTGTIPRNYESSLVQGFSDLSMSSPYNTSSYLQPLRHYDLPGQVPFHPDYPESPVPSVNQVSEYNNPSTTLGRVGSPYNYMDNRIARAQDYLAAEAAGFSSKEVVVKSSKVQGKVKVGFTFANDVESVYVKYRNLSKRKFL